VTEFCISQYVSHFAAYNAQWFHHQSSSSGCGAVDGLGAVIVNYGYSINQSFYSRWGIMCNDFTISPLLQVVALLMGWVRLLSIMATMCKGFTISLLLQVVAPLVGWVRLL